MNSDNVATTYASSQDMLYGAHYATLASAKVTYESNTAKFVMEYATPNTQKEAFDNTLPKTSTGNVINDDNLGTTKITKSNYIELTVPKHYFYITKLEIVTNVKPCGKGGIGSCAPVIIITRKEYYKGQKFVVANAGGNVDTPCIIGVV